MITRTHTTLALVVAATLLGACGTDSGSSDGNDDTAETTVADSATTSPITTDPPDTVPATTPDTTSAGADLPDWASGEMVTVESDTGPIEMPVELVPFCESSRSFYVAARGLDFVEPSQAGTARQLFAALTALAPAAIGTAPSTEFAAEPIAADEQLAVLVPAMEQIDYDAARVPELDDPQLVVDTLTEFAATRAGLLEFLVTACGADEAVLVDQALEAADIAATAAGETIEPVEAVAGTAIANERSTIEVSVPTDWVDVEDGTDGGYDILVASTDLGAFADLAAPGAYVLRGEGGFRDGGFVGRVLETQSQLESAGCSVADELDYDDGTYVGQERVFDCGTDGLDVRIFGGTTEDEALYAMVLLAQPVDQPGVRQLIVETFLVS